MRTIAMGDTGRTLSALCLGAMNFGTKLTARESIQLLDRYYEEGVRIIDTANNYADWWGGDWSESETVMENWMREHASHPSWRLTMNSSITASLTRRTSSFSAARAPRAAPFPSERTASFLLNTGGARHGRTSSSTLGCCLARRCQNASGSLRLDAPVSTDHTSSGECRLDRTIGGKPGLAEHRIERGSDVLTR